MMQKYNKILLNLHDYTSRMKKAITKLLMLAALVLGAAACIETTTTNQYMEGTITFDIHDFVHTGDVVELTARGITTPEDPTWGWVITTIHPDTLYSPTIVVQFPEEPGEFTIKALAYHPDYIVESSKRTVVTVDTTIGTGSLKGLPYKRQKVYVDSRDTRAYRYQRIGNLDWFAENLAWEGAGYVYAQSPVLNKVFGRHYTWQEATGGNICPEGWRIPDNADWEDMGKALCGGDVEFDKDWPGAASLVTPDAYFNGERFWPFSVNNTHQATVRFNPLPCGYMQTNNGGFYGLSSYGMWWSASPFDDDNAYYRYIYWDSADFRPGFTSKSGIALNVRCVRN